MSCPCIHVVLVSKLVKSLILDFHPPVNSNLMIKKHESGRTCKLHEEARKSYNPKITVRFRNSKEASEDNQPFHK